jgi:hypothetical protein
LAHSCLNHFTAKLRQRFYVIRGDSYNDITTSESNAASRSVRPYFADFNPFGVSASASRFNKPLVAAA